MKSQQRKLNKRVLRYLQTCDYWMRELSGWLWHRRENTLVRSQWVQLAKDIKRGEKLIASVKKEVAK